ncbi:MAG: hypothetical protein JW779_15900 [Candidatus Thorarchaeota archaeon]|nr:hypothetical protein [Candidatus Thorarchaeota archaeon]
MALDLLLDQTFEPFRDWALVINSHIIWMSNLLLAFFIVGGFLFWYFAIIYSRHDVPPRSSLFLAFIAGGALVGEIVKGDWSQLVPLIVEAIAAAILIMEIILYARVVIPATEKSEKSGVLLYFVGFLLWIMALPLGVILGNIPGVPSFIGNSWPLPYTIGLLLVAFTVNRNPRLLFVSEARVLDYLVLDDNGVLVFAHRFQEYKGSVDSELMGSAMSGVLSLMKEMLASGQIVKRIDHGDVKILVEPGDITTSLLVVSKENIRFRQTLRSLSLEFESSYRDELKKEIANLVVFEPHRKRVKEVLS